ncbi:TetR/AcrR family transcriptional regulator [Corynebacterium mastitidis]|uniref:TetR/AcrR family transcriptional regulator n=1 Tax=Corynebacterium mastitidis TaxID=161890 RepID=A0ABU8NVH8_9CORY
MSTLRRGDYHHGDLRRTLIRSGRELLTTGENFSLRAVAKMAGVSPTATYRHFADRKALESAIAGQGYRELHERLAGAAREITGLGDGWKIAVAYASWALENPAIFSLMFTTDCDPCAEERAHAAAEIREFFAQEVGRWIPGSENNDRTVAIWSFMHGITLLHAEGKLSTQRPGEMEERIRGSWETIFPEG